MTFYNLPSIVMFDFAQNGVPFWVTTMDGPLKGATLPSLNPEAARQLQPACRVVGCVLYLAAWLDEGADPHPDADSNHDPQTPKPRSWPSKTTQTLTHALTLTKP